MATVNEIAEWMLFEYSNQNRLIQRVAARAIRTRFGEEYVFRNKNGNYGIRKDIPEVFREMTPEDVVWSRSRQLWRKRRDSDPPNTRMVK